MFLLLGFVTADIRSSFDCKMRQLAISFAQKIQPFRSHEAFVDIAAALNGTREKPSDCNVIAPPATSRSSASRFVQEPLVEFRGGIICYVDPLNGNDQSGDGSLNNPFKSLPPALAATRASPGPNDTIVLREGILYDTPTLVLGVQDKGLKIQAYPGEEAWVSGGKLLRGLNWKPFNVSQPSSNWIVVNNTNAVFGSGSGVVFVKKTQTWKECEALCVSDLKAGGSCTVWTWHDTNTGTYALDCYFRTDNKWSPKSEPDHVSGHVEYPGKNIWVASLAGQVRIFQSFIASL